MTNKELFNIAIESGFDETDTFCLQGVSEIDRGVSVQEYPCGEALVAFAKRLAERLGVELRLRDA